MADQEEERPITLRWFDNRTGKEHTLSDSNELTIRSRLFTLVLDLIKGRIREIHVVH